MTLDDFANLYLDEHDALAYRSLSGEAMTEIERVRLAELAAMLAPLLPRPVPMAPDVVAMVAEARRLNNPRPAQAPIIPRCYY